MADISLPAGAFAAIKSGSPIPTPAAAAKNDSTPKAELNRVTEPVTKTRKAPVEVEVPQNEPPADLTPAEKKIWKLKADGEEFEFDASDEEAIKREIMKARGADKRFKSAAEMRQQAEQFLGMLKDPQSLRKVLEDPRIGVDLKKFAKDYVWEQIQEEQMTPEQKTQRQRDREFEQLKAEKESRERESKEAETRKKQAHFEEIYQDKIMKALNTQGITASHENVKAMAGHMLLAIEQGIDLEPEEIASYMITNTDQIVRNYIASLPLEKIKALMGDENLTKLRKMDLEKLKSPQSNPFPARTKPRKEKIKEQPKRLGASEWTASAIKEFLARK